MNILDKDQGEMALTFARPATEKFESVNVAYGELGEPLESVWRLTRTAKP